MQHSPQIGRVAGIPLRVHWSFLVLAGLLVVGDAGGSASAFAGSMAWFVAVFASVLVHEGAHALVAKRRGLVVRDIVLLPIGGVSEILHLRRGSRDEFTVSLVGPLASLALALALSLVAIAGGLRMWPPTLATGAFVVDIMWANVLLGLGNLFPALPLDGGHVLRAHLSRRQDEGRATATVARWSVTAGYAVIGLGLLFDLWLALVGVFLVLGANAERRAVEIRGRIGGRRVRDLMVPTTDSLEASMAAADAANLLRSEPGRSHAVLLAGRYLGMVAWNDLDAIPKGAALGRFTDDSVPLLAPDDELFPDALAALQACGRDALAVGDDGRVSGLLYRTDVDRVVRRALDSRPSARTGPSPIGTGHHAHDATGSTWGSGRRAG